MPEPTATIFRTYDADDYTEALNLIEVLVNLEVSFTLGYDGTIWRFGIMMTGTVIPAAKRDDPHA